MSMVNLVPIGVEIEWMYNRCSLEKEFIELININPSTFIYPIINQVDSCHGGVYNQLT